MKFILMTKSDGEPVVINVAHIVAMYEIAERQTRIVLTAGQDFDVEMPLAALHENIESAIRAN